MFRGFEMGQLKIVLALVAVLLVGLAGGRWMGRREAQSAVRVSGAHVVHAPGALVTPGAATAASPELPAETPAPIEEVKVSPLEARGLIDLNTATAEDLQLLPGIGPSKATAILRDRETKGPFRTTGDLTRVSGIGPKTLENLLPYITVQNMEGAANPPAVVASPLEQPVRVNVATAEELQTLKYVGEATASKIIADRATNGPFRRPQDLLRIKGLGPKFLEANKDRLRFD
jgi:competence protein ComEA